MWIISIVIILIFCIWLSHVSHSNYVEKDNSVGKILSSPFAYFEYEIVGESFYQNNLLKIIGSKSEESIELKVNALLQRDLNNKHDKNAVAVYVNDLQVGHLNRHDAKFFCEIIKSKRFKDNDCFDVDGLIVGGWKRKNSEGNLGVKLNIDEEIRNIIIEKY